MTGKDYLKNYQVILHEVKEFNKIASKGPFEVDKENVTVQEKDKPSGKDYIEVEVTRGNIVLHINGFIKHGSKEYETVGIRVIKIIGENFESVYPTTDIKTAAAEGTTEKLREALILADKL